MKDGRMEKKEGKIRERKEMKKGNEERKLKEEGN